MTPVPMRTDCKNYESRTYDDGETVRKCNLDLAPEAPWRCPENCSAYAPRLADVNWVHEHLVAPPTPDEPPNMESLYPRFASPLATFTGETLRRTCLRQFAGFGVQRNKVHAVTSVCFGVFFFQTRGNRVHLRLGLGQAYARS